MPSLNLHRQHHQFFGQHHQFLGHETDDVGDEDFSQDLLLFWHATGREEEYNIDTEEIKVTNEKLKILKDHSKIYLFVVSKKCILERSKPSLPCVFHSILFPTKFQFFS